MSRAEPAGSTGNDGADPNAAGPPPRPPSLGRALRDGATDLYQNSWRVVPWNVLWAVGLVVALWAWTQAGSLVAALVAVPLAIPLAALARLGGQATRHLDVNLSDGLEPIRRRPGGVLLGGLGFVVAILVFVVNIVSGLSVGGPLGWAFATLAGWGLVTAIGFGFAYWPLLTDPGRDHLPSREIARLAGLLLLAHPLRLGALGLTLTILLVVSTVVFAVLVTVAVGFALLAACRYVLPAADRLEERLTARSTMKRGPSPSPRRR